MPSRAQIAAYLDATTGPPRQADLIFVPGTRLPDPAAIAARLLADDVAPLVLVTGGTNRVTGANEAATLRRELVSLGVPPGSIMVEDTSTNTLENVVRGWEIAAARFSDRPLESVVAVCKWRSTRGYAHAPSLVLAHRCAVVAPGADNCPRQSRF